MKAAIAFLSVIPAAALFAADPPAAAVRVERLADRNWVVAGRPAVAQVIVRNPDAADATGELRLRIFQASATTLLPLGPAKPWKQLPIAAGRATVEDVALELPALRVPTWFELRFEDSRGVTAGRVPVLALPAAPLARLPELLKQHHVALLDPSHKISDLLREQHVAIEELDPAAESKPAAALTLIVAGRDGRDESARLATVLAGRGVPVVLIGFSRRQADTVTWTRGAGAGAVTAAIFSSAENLRSSLPDQARLVRIIESALAGEPWPGAGFANLDDP